MWSLWSASRKPLSDRGSLRDAKYGSSPELHSSTRHWGEFSNSIFTLQMGTDFQYATQVHYEAQNRRYFLLISKSKFASDLVMVRNVLKYIGITSKWNVISEGRYGAPISTPCKRVTNHRNPAEISFISGGGMCSQWKCAHDNPLLIACWWRNSSCALLISCITTEELPWHCFRFPKNRARDMASI